MRHMRRLPYTSSFHTAQPLIASQDLSPFQVAAWPNVSSAHGSRNAAIPVKASSEESFQRPAVLSDFGRAAESCLLAISASLIDSAAQLDAWDRR